jgi:AcrR family transcriptional regulator
MPKTVDHDQRRRELAAATWRVILRDGIDGTTTREIAREAGCSAGILAHYFAGKDEILLAALRLSHSEITARFRKQFAGKSGLPVLREYLLDYVPLTPQHDRETHLEMSFWSRALVSDDLRAVQRQESAGPRATLRRLVTELQVAGVLVATDPDDLADTLLAFADGLSVHRLMYPERFPRKRLTALVDAQLAVWTADVTSGRGAAPRRAAGAGRG